MTLAEFRRQKDDLFRGSDSPLDPARRRTFRALRYFPERNELCFSVPLIPDQTAPAVVLDTSTGVPREYHSAGTVTFVVQGHSIVFTVFQDRSGLFLPFRDGTCGAESYGAGRYLEPEPLGDGQIKLDFNFAYNPYCAYSHEYSCPLPPRRNWTDVRIEAGEKTYD